MQYFTDGARDNDDVRRNGKIITPGFKLDRVCDSTERWNARDQGMRCYDVPALPPVIEGQFFNKRVCGQRGGLPFVDTIRPNRNNTCPEGTSPCSTNTTTQHTVCYPPGQFNQSCPITDFNIVDDSQVNVYRNLGYTLVKYAYA